MLITHLALGLILLVLTMAKVEVDAKSFKCQSDADCSECRVCDQMSGQCRAKISKTCRTDKDCRQGQRCTRSAWTSEKHCVDSPFECKDNDDCDQGRDCVLVGSVKQCVNRGSRKCHNDTECPRRTHRCSRQGVCVKLRLRQCEDDEECVALHKDKGMSKKQVCVYLTEVASGRKFCLEEECVEDQDCKEGKKCVASRFKGRTCMQPTTLCRHDEECEECEVCVKSNLNDVSTCSPSPGPKCSTHADCKELRRCLRRRHAEANEAKRCVVVNAKLCEEKKECEARNEECVISHIFEDVHECLRSPRRCSHHNECNKHEECIETLITGFNGPQWSPRCLVVPFPRCNHGGCGQRGGECVVHKAYGRVCVCREHFGTECRTDGDCIDDHVCDTLNKRCVDAPHCSVVGTPCSPPSSWPSPTAPFLTWECVRVQYFKWNSVRCLPMPSICHSDAQCQSGRREVCRELFRNGRHGLPHAGGQHNFYRYGRRCLPPHLQLHAEAATVHRDPVQPCSGATVSVDNVDKKDKEDNVDKEDNGNKEDNVDKEDNGNKENSTERNHEEKAMTSASLLTTSTTPPIVLVPDLLVSGEDQASSSPETEDTDEDVFDHSGDEEQVESSGQEGVADELLLGSAAVDEDEERADDKDVASGSETLDYMKAIASSEERNSLSKKTLDKTSNLRRNRGERLGLKGRSKKTLRTQRWPKRSQRNVKNQDLKDGSRRKAFSRVVDSIVV